MQTVAQHCSSPQVASTQHDSRCLHELGRHTEQTMGLLVHVGWWYAVVVVTAQPTLRPVQIVWENSHPALEWLFGLLLSSGQLALSL